jgi:hypothetical protein
VWAFGVTAWEILTEGTRPYFALEHSEIVRHVCEGGRLPRGELVVPCSDKLWDIIASCWENTASDRPTFSRLALLLASVLGDAMQGDSESANKQTEAKGTAQVSPLQVSHYDVVMEKVRSILDKFTLANFEKLSDDLVKLEVVNPEELKGIASIIFDKALEQPRLYALLCNKIQHLLPKFPNPECTGQEKALSFKRFLLNTCQQEFEQAGECEGLQEANETEGQHAVKLRTMRMRMLGNIKFIGELFAQKLLNEIIMHECITRLLKSKDQDHFECLCTLMATIGKLLDHEKAKHYMDYYFKEVSPYSTAHFYGLRCILDSVL